MCIEVGFRREGGRDREWEIEMEEKRETEEEGVGDEERWSTRVGKEDGGVETDLQTPGTEHNDKKREHCRTKVHNEYSLTG
ncbi:hypothetical protein BgiMline_014319 [Biomphalaria glabrata]|nr:hypothetical protein BgiMline_013083 [Biomphalaria glabrata]KAI8773247.1 hypothetical protein BgiBS90_025665 [Biomphalaria glabrata]